MEEKLQHKRKPPPSHHIHRALIQTDENTDMITFTDRQKEGLNVTPLSLALSLSSTSTSLYSFKASKRMFPSLWKRKRTGKVMSSVLRPSPAI